MFLAVYAFAAALGLTSDNLGAGAASVTTCDDDGFAIEGVVLGGAGEVTQITVGGIATTCAGGQITINLVTDDGASIGAGGPVPVTVPSTTLAIAGVPAPEVLPSLADVQRQVVIVVGP